MRLPRAVFIVTLVASVSAFAVCCSTRFFDHRGSACHGDLHVRGCYRGRLGFGPNLVALRRLTGSYVERVFNGAKPADMPIQLPDRFTLSLNLRAADQLKLTLPLTFLASVDEVIE